MGRVKVRRRKKQSLFKPTYWLPLVVVGILVLIGAAAILSGQKNKNGTSSSGPTQFDSNFKPEVTGAPRVVVPQDSFDYGDVKLGSTVTTVFDVRNVGDKPLVILGEPQVEAVEGCWPPRAVVSSTTIEPGYQATVTLQFTMHGGMGGQHEFRVHLRTNDPEEPEKLLTIRSNWVE